MDDSPSRRIVLGAQGPWKLVFKHGNIFDRLNCEEKPWQVYAGDWFPQCYSLATFGLGHRVGRGFEPFANFRVQVSDPSYAPAYTFIEPDYGRTHSDFRCGNSQHPLDDVARGDQLIKDVYHAIRQSPHWETSVLIITWDEHGGFYDHVTPPASVAPAAPDDNTVGIIWSPWEGIPPWPVDFNTYGFDFTQLGPRVPRWSSRR